jgi:hypothetical protein
MSIKPVIEKQMNKFRNRFKDWALKFFVLVGYDTTIKNDIFRIKYLKDNACLPYIMRYENCYTSPYKNFYTDIAAYCNQVSIFKKMTFEQFLYKRHTKKNRIEFSLNLWRNNQ